MAEKIKQVIHWFSDGVDFKEFLALCIISILGYSVYFMCKKMMGVGLKELDIEFFKIVSTNILIILCFYYGGNSAKDIIQTLFDNKLFNKNKKINNNIIYGEGGEINNGYNSNIS